MYEYLIVYWSNKTSTVYNDFVFANSHREAFEKVLKQPLMPHLNILNIIYIGESTGSEGSGSNTAND